MPVTKYGRGKNPNSHRNQKKVDRRRLTIPVSCSKAQKQKIDKALFFVKDRYRSAYQIRLIQAAIANKFKELADSECNDAEFQISVSPDIRDQIYRWCEQNLAPGTRSRWIVQIILSQP